MCDYEFTTHLVCLFFVIPLDVVLYQLVDNQTVEFVADYEHYEIKI